MLPAMGSSRHLYVRLHRPVRCRYRSVIGGENRHACGKKQARCGAGAC